MTPSPQPAPSAAHIAFEQRLAEIARSARSYQEIDKLATTAARALVPFVRPGLAPP